jgi:uncharacterized protein (DUF697 family)
MEENNKPETESSPSEKIIHNHIAFSMIAGAIPVPIVDIVAVTAIQVDMIHQLAELYSVDFNKDKGKSIATSLTGTTFARLGASAIKTIPGVGTWLGVTFQVILAGASTYALGQLFNNHFSSKGNLFDFDTEAMKKKYEEYVEKGKKVAENLYKEQKSSDNLDTIEKLHKLKESGAITEEEFEKAKQSILDKINKK